MAHVHGGRKEVVNGTLKLSSQGLSAELPTWLKEDPKIASSLNVLLLNKNEFATLPDLRKLVKCDRLVLNGNKLTHVAAGALPPSVQALELVNNKITTIECKALSELPKLRKLDLCANHLNDAAFADASSTICGCKNLEFLDVSSNKLTTLPEAFTLPIHVTELRVSLNPLFKLPKAVLQANAHPCIHAYIRAHSHSRTPAHPNSGPPPTTPLAFMSWFDLSKRAVQRISRTHYGTVQPLRAAMRRDGHAKPVGARLGPQPFDLATPGGQGHSHCSLARSPPEARQEGSPGGIADRCRLLVIIRGSNSNVSVLHTTSWWPCLT